MGEQDSFEKEVLKSERLLAIFKEILYKNILKIEDMNKLNDITYSQIKDCISRIIIVPKNDGKVYNELSVWQKR